MKANRDAIDEIGELKSRLERPEEFRCANETAQRLVLGLLIQSRMNYVCSAPGPPTCTTPSTQFVFAPRCHRWLFFKLNTLATDPG